jgi:cytochrome c-type biogenesis protein CcmH/NrfG
MIDPDRVLQPLREEEAAIGRLDSYQSQAELADAVVAVRDAVDRALRLLLRNDPGVPDEVRLKALSTKDLSRDELIPALRRRERISLTLAGMVHELEGASARAISTDVQAADADLARRVVEALRLEVRGTGDARVEQAAHRMVESLDAEDRTVHEVPPPAPAWTRWRLLAGAGAFALVAILMAIFLTRKSPLERGIEAFAADDHVRAEAHFEDAMRADSTDVEVLLYLGRIYRRDGRLPDAARVLGSAENLAPEDADVRRELGYLFMDLNQPTFAAQQFDRARELEPENPRSWIGLIRALRAAGDPQSEVWLERAPPEVRAALTSVTPPRENG